MAHLTRWAVAGMLLAVAGCDSFRGTTLSERRPGTPSSAAEPESKEPKVEPAPPPPIHSSTRLSAGKMLESEGNLAGAIEQYREALKDDPRSIEAYTRLGIAYNRTQRFEDAMKMFLRAIEIAPEKAYLHNNLGFSYVLAARYRDAERAFRQALTLRPGYQRARMNLALVLAQTGRNDEALVEFEKVVSRDAAHFNLGLIQAADKRYAAAEESFRTALAINPASPGAAQQLARVTALRRGVGGPGSPTIASLAAPDAAETPGPPAAMPIVVPTSQPATGMPAPLPVSR
ncbi:MAG: tetratricopeptide repeat protein [Phycisphaerae bacterium]|nr:tetratricopeptide repeat protein [Phycisphaerae bacterium]